MKTLNHELITCDNLNRRFFIAVSLVTGSTQVVEAVLNENEQQICNVI